MNFNYYPIFYGIPTNSQFLNYYDHDLINCLANNFNKKIISRKTYEKNSTSEVNLNKLLPINDKNDSITNFKTMTAVQLRHIAENKGIDIRKISEISGRRIYRTKEELICDLSH